MLFWKLPGMFKVQTFVHFSCGVMPTGPVSGPFDLFMTDSPAPLFGAIELLVNTDHAGE